MISTLRVALAQINLVVGDIDGNTRRVVDSIARARGLDADVVVFPELTLTGYPPEDLLLRTDFVVAAERALQSLAREVVGIVAVVGHPQRRDARLYNAASVLRDGRIEAVYCKRALPNYGVFDEKRYFSEGDRDLVIDVGGWRLGVSICEDVWDGDPVRSSVDAGAEIILNLNASPYHMNKSAERENDVVGGVARRFGVPVVYTNLVGGQDELVFDGGSFVVGRDGLVAHRVAQFEETCSVAAFEHADGGDVDVIGGVLEAPVTGEEPVYRALVTGVRDYVFKNGFPGAVIGLSGGIDSALTLALACDALGPERVTAVTMPSRYTRDISVADALEQCRRLGVRCERIDIEPVFEAFLAQLAPVFDGAGADTTEENIQARCRGTLLMAISNKTGRIVLTTGNKSEMAVGYATLYGDMAGGFAAIKDVPKTWVYRLARYRNRLAAVIPERVIERPPSAELAEDQYDQDTLPDYDTLDGIVQGYVEEDLSVAEITARGIPEQEVRRVVAMINRNEYKRRQAPPGVRISRRAFGRDRRYPLTSGFRFDS